MKNLFNEFRPKTFGDIKGQDGIKTIMLKSIKNNLLSNFYIIFGKRGSGKTTISRIFAKAINCESFKSNEKICNKCLEKKNSFLDIYEFNTAKYRGINDVAEIINQLLAIPQFGKKKIVIFDEAHMFTKDALNSLLKILEEPPIHLIFIFLTTEIDLLPETIKSRSILINCNILNKKDIYNILSNIIKKKKLLFDDNIINYIISNSKGDARKAINMLEIFIIKKKIDLIDINYEHIDVFKKLDMLISDKEKNIVKLKKIDLFFEKKIIIGLNIKHFLINFFYYIKKNNFNRYYKYLNIFMSGIKLYSIYDTFFINYIFSKIINLE